MSPTIMGKFPINEAPAALRQVRPLPDNARLLALESVWMEGDAIQQLGRVAAMSDCLAAVGMPDLHAGPGIPIGAALAFGEAVHPHLVGSDAGCGARVVAFSKLKVRGDALERRVRSEFEGSVFDSLIFDVEDDLDAVGLLDAIWHRGVAALAERDVPEELAAFVTSAGVADEPSWLPASAALPEDLARPEYARALGTIGGGNHFVELGRVAELVDADVAEALGLSRRGHAVIAHSGSRGLGRALAASWGMDALDDPEARARYLGQLAGAVRFAIANRALLCWRMLAACGVARELPLLGGQRRHEQQAVLEHPAPE